jgi:spermidine synthase
VLFLFLYENTHAAAITIASFLSGLALSGRVFSSFDKRRKPDNRKVLKVLQLALILYVLAILRHYPWIPIIFDGIHSLSLSLPQISYFLKIAFVFIYLFVPAFFIGGAFPLINGLYIKASEDVTAGTGRVYFYDILGAVLGALVAGFYLIPVLGLDRALLIPLLINAMMFASLLDLKPVLRLVLGCLSAALIALGILVEEPIMSLVRVQQTQNIGLQKSLLKEFDRRFGRIIFQKNSPFGVVTVGEDVHGIAGLRSLFVNYRDMCGMQVRAEQNIGLAVSDELSKGAKVLNIGLGCGIMAGSILQNVNVDRLDLVEINPVIVEAARYFEQENKGLLDDRRTKIIIQDGAEFIRNTSVMYEAILVDIEEPSIVHSSPLFTKEYFEYYRDHLNPGAVLSVWVINSPHVVAKI